MTSPELLLWAYTVVNNELRLRKMLTERMGVLQGYSVRQKVWKRLDRDDAL